LTRPPTDVSNYEALYETTQQVLEGCVREDEVAGSEAAGR